MKIQIYSSEEINKNFLFNEKQTEVGSPLKTYKGSVVRRSPKYGVGKQMVDSIYVHKDYADEVVPDDILLRCKQILSEEEPGFRYNCIKYTPSRDRVAFQEAPDFDSSREPVVGRWVAVELLDPDDYSITSGRSSYIFHHKWCWCRNDYTGFDVAESWNWSKKWLSTLQEVSDGNGIDRWNAQLDKYDLPHDN